jgi:hypothetical protein
MNQSELKKEANWPDDKSDWPVDKHKLILHSAFCDGIITTLLVQMITISCAYFIFWGFN